ncbi:hypothetical protein BC829DRAFT_402849 [Chytridium lagenaria]|nr:hypothetical protein BC829DRAFT_402849 [Chytridium lagenaria]
MSLVNHHPLLQSPVSAECDIADVAVGWTRPYKSMDLAERRMQLLKEDTMTRKRQSLNIPFRADVQEQISPASSRSSSSSNSPSNLRTPPPPPHRCLHTVSKSDTLEGISIQYVCQLAELKRINKLWTADSIHLRKTLYIPVIPPPTSLDFQLRHAPSAHPDNIRRIKRERQSTDSEATYASASSFGDRERRLSAASYTSTSTSAEVSPLSSITGSANAKSIEDLLHQIDEDVSNVCEALAQLDSMPHATSSLLHRSESFSKASVLTAKTSMVETGDSCGINLITSSTTRVSLLPISTSQNLLSPTSPPLAVCRSPTEDTSSTRLTSPTRTSLQEFPPKNVEIVIELTPLLRRLPLTAQRAVAEDVRRRTASSFSTMDTFVSPNIVIQQPSRAEVTVKTVKIASSDQSWTSTAKNNLLSLP